MQDKNFVFHSELDACVVCSSNTDGAPIVCQLCVEEETVGEESYLKQDEVCN